MTTTVYLQKAIHPESGLHPCGPYPIEVNKTDIVGESGYVEKLRKEFGERQLRGTAITIRNSKDGELSEERISVEERFRSILKSIPYNTCIEIGTWRGSSTPLLAHYAKKSVVAIDIYNYPEPHMVWPYFGVKDKIKHVICKSNEEKANIIRRTNFEFAFLDGLHSYEGVKFDFECVKKCGVVLFHDYEIMDGVTYFVNELDPKEVRILEPFAIWIRQK